MLTFIKAIRPLNLLFVLALQLISYFSFIVPFKEHVHLLLYPKYIVPFSLVTVLITLGGYLINDYIDFESDISNKKTHKLQNRLHYLYSYLFVTIIGGVLASWIAWSLDHLQWVGLYFAAIVLLVVYSTHFKKWPLIGNLIVAFFGVGSIAIFLFAEQNVLNTTALPDLYKTKQLWSLIYIFMGFIFLSSMVREIVKDLEDIAGDKYANYNTLPIVTSIKTSKVVAIIFMALLFITLSYWYLSSRSDQHFLVRLSLVIFVIAPIFNIVRRLIKAQNKIEFNTISKDLKLHMLLGLIYICLYVWT